MAKTRVGINGFGRIGRNFFRASLTRDADFEIVAFNDLGDAHDDGAPAQVRLDSRPARRATSRSRAASIKAAGQRDQAARRARPGGAAVGRPRRRRRDRVDRLLHRAARARRSTSTPARRRSSSRRPRPIPDITLVLGVNDDKYDPEAHHIISNASCTTNCLGPLAKVLNDTSAIEQRVHDDDPRLHAGPERLQDMPHSDLRRARAAAINLIPTSTGAAQGDRRSCCRSSQGKLDGVAVRAPIPTGSVTDLVGAALARGDRRRGQRGLRGGGGRAGRCRATSQYSTDAARLVATSTSRRTRASSTAS